MFPPVYGCKPSNKLFHLIKFCEYICLSQFEDYMKRKQLPKSFFFAVSLFSLSAFAFVNANVISDSCGSSQPSLVQQVQEIGGEDAAKIAPDITVVGHLIKLARHYFSRP